MHAHTHTHTHIHIHTCTHTQEKEEQALLTTRREKAKADAEWMRKVTSSSFTPGNQTGTTGLSTQVVAEQLKLEKDRESELDLLYQ